MSASSLQLGINRSFVQVALRLFKNSYASNRGHHFSTANDGREFHGTTMVNNIKPGLLLRLDVSAFVLVVLQVGYTSYTSGGRKLVHRRKSSGLPHTSSGC